MARYLLWTPGATGRKAQLWPVPREQPGGSAAFRVPSLISLFRTGDVVYKYLTFPVGFAMDNLQQAARSWRIRRRIKRLLFSWVVICFLCAEAGASWFGIFIAEHAPMPLVDAKVIAERTATVVLLVSFAAMMASAVLQLRARERVRRIESSQLQSAHAT
jgi:hypothetical protein